MKSSDKKTTKKGDNKVQVELDTEEVIEKVGDIIRNVRIKKKIEVTDVAETLCIRKVYLEAIENSKYEDMPEHPYGVGFVRSYADFLGLSGSRMADLYRTELNIKVDSVSCPIERMESETVVPSKKYILFGIIIVVLLYLFWFLFDKYYVNFTELKLVEDVSTNDTFALQVESFETASSDVKENVIEDNGGVIDLTEVPTEENVEQIKIEDGIYVVNDDANTSTNEAIKAEGVEVKMLAHVWFEAKDDKKLYVSKEFNVGDTYKVPSKKGMVISVGNPDSVEVYIDGSLVKNVFTKTKKLNVGLDKFIEQKRH